MTLGAFSYIYPVKYIVDIERSEFNWGARTEGPLPLHLYFLSDDC